MFPCRYYFEHLKVKEEDSKGLVVTLTDKYCDVMVQAVSPWVRSDDDAIYYTEVHIEHVNKPISVGLTSEVLEDANVVFAYVYDGDGETRIGGPFDYASSRGWPTYGAGDSIGIGLRAATGEIFCTINGTLIGLFGRINNKLAYYLTVLFSGPVEFYIANSNKFNISPLSFTKVSAAKKLYLSGDFEEALDSYSTEINSNPNDHLLYLYRAECFKALSRYSEGLTDTECCLRLAPRCCESYIAHSVMLEREERYYEALDVLFVGLQHYPYDTRLAYCITQLMNELMANAPAQCESEWESSYAHINSAYNFVAADNGESLWVFTPLVTATLRRFGYFLPILTRNNTLHPAAYIFKLVVEYEADFNELVQENPILWIQNLLYYANSLTDKLLLVNSVLVLGCVELWINKFLPTHSILRARLHWGLGWCMSEEGKANDGLVAIDILERNWPQLTTEYICLYYNVLNASVLFESLNFKEAEKFYFTALFGFKELLVYNPQVLHSLVTVTNNLGNLYFELNDTSMALHFYQQNLNYMTTDTTMYATKILHTTINIAELNGNLEIELLHNVRDTFSASTVLTAVDVLYLLRLWNLYCRKETKTHAHELLAFIQEKNTNKFPPNVQGRLEQAIATQALTEEDYPKSIAHMEQVQQYTAYFKISEKLNYLVQYAAILIAADRCFDAINYIYNAIVLQSSTFENIMRDLGTRQRWFSMQGVANRNLQVVVEEYIRKVFSKSLDITICSASESAAERFAFVTCSYLISVKSMYGDSMKTNASLNTHEVATKCYYYDKLIAMSHSRQEIHTEEQVSMEKGRYLNKVFSSGITALSAEKIISNLPENTVYCEYFLSAAGARNEPHYFAILLSKYHPTEMRFLVLAMQSEVADLIRKIRTENGVMERGNDEEEPLFALDFGSGGPDSDTESDESANIIQLRKLIWDPINKYITTEKRIFIAPIAQLLLFPFEIFPSKADDVLLGDIFTINYVTNGRDILRFVSRTDEIISATPSIVLAHPNFDLCESSSTERNLSVKSRLRFNALAGTKKEGQLVGKLLGVLPIMDDSAVVSVVKTCQSPEVLHISTHGLHESDNSTSLVFAGFNSYEAGKPVPEGALDGRLLASETRYLALQGTKLVNLSTCISGYAKTLPLESSLGLRGGFLAAGAQCVLVSLCGVPDIDTTAFMEIFYTNLVKKGATVNESVKEAQRQFREAKKSLFVWAAFIVVGNGDVRITG